jgi:hypothetical protein
MNEDFSTGLVLKLDSPVNVVLKKASTLVVVLFTGP